MVEMMGGKIWVESVWVKEVLFIHFGAWWPRAKDLFTKSIQNLKGTRALIVDDNRPARSIKSNAYRLSFKVKIACSGEEASHYT